MGVLDSLTCLFNQLLQTIVISQPNHRQYPSPIAGCQAIPQDVHITAAVDGISGLKSILSQFEGLGRTLALATV